MKNIVKLIIAATLVAPFSFAQNAPYTLDVQALNPSDYWKLDNNQGNAHSGGPGLANGVATGVKFTGPGTGAPIGDANGSAAILNSSVGQYLTIPGAAGTGGPVSFDTSHAFTLMVWIKTANQGISAMPIISKVDSAQTGYTLLIDNGTFPGSQKGGGRLALALDFQGSVSVVETIFPVNDGVWHFLVATYDGSGLQAGIQLYVDGAHAFGLGGPNAQVAGSILNPGSFAIGAVPAVPSVGTFEGDIDEVAVFGTALTAAQVQKLASDAVTSGRLLSQFAFGGGWYSAVYFTNTGSSTVTFTVNFTADDGTPLNIPSLGGSSTTLTLPTDGTAVVEAPNVGSLNQGYVGASLPPGVIGYGVFRQSVPSIPDQEAVVPFSGTNHTKSTLVYDETAFTTAAAIANPGAASITVTITVLKSDGTVIGSTTLVLPPNTHTAKVLNSLPNLSGMQGNRGIATFSVSSGNLAVLGLRFSGAAFTSIPTVDQ